MDMQTARQVLGKKDITIDDLYRLQQDKPQLFISETNQDDVQELRDIIDDCCADPDYVKSLLSRICRSKYKLGYQAGRKYVQGLFES